MKKWILVIIMAILGCSSVFNYFYMNNFSTSSEEVKVYLVPFLISAVVKHDMLEKLSTFYLFGGIFIIVLSILFTLLMLKKNKRVHSRQA
ncbi:hypothetical protein [Priestia megaterium]|uniref:hypothetical protein n=1 Tax=Priestia megaterium TaxID=1404 RepID=UPI0021D65F9D|nr:hypothetical protein [Priestia megaterium]MCU7741509.1 hypothetical protein [Priestia megaterium]